MTLSLCNWPFLEDRFDISVPPQSRYLSFPTLDDEGDSTAMNMERPYIVEVFWANKWAPLTHGIGSEQFNYLNSDQAGQFQDPVQNWRWSQEGKFEIWPINATAVTIRFTGQRALDTLAALSDTADLDDQLLVLAVAADMLRRSNQADADLREQQFQRRLIQIRASYPGWKSLVFGENDLESAQTPRLVGIRVGVAGN
jgi:hypothetical protein